jgi:hypothetical protein
MMEHHSQSQSEYSMMSIATKVFGGLVAVVILGGILYLVYQKSGLDTAYDRQTAYDNCKASILANVAGQSKVHFVNTPENSQTFPNRNGYTMVMEMQIEDQGQARSVSYNCDVVENKTWVSQLVHEFFH